MKLIDLLRVLVDMVNTEIVICDSHNKEIERINRMFLRQDSDVLQFEVICVRTQVIQTKEIGYFMGTEASITLGVKTMIGVRKVEE